MKCTVSGHPGHVCAGPVRPARFDVPLCTIARLEIQEDGLQAFDRRYQVDLRLIGAGLAEREEVAA